MLRDLDIQYINAAKVAALGLIIIGGITVNKTMAFTGILLLTCISLSAREI